jgi:two-component system, cell cycle response regulator DivK
MVALSPQNAPASGRPLILVADDMEDIRDMYAHYLSGQGFRPELACTGLEALSKASVLHPDVIVMDLNMPELDGWEATRRLKSSDLTRAIPVIALTGLAVSQSKQAALEAGCDGYLTKPCFPDTLADEIRRVLRRVRRGH